MVGTEVVVLTRDVAEGEVIARVLLKDQFINVSSPTGKVFYVKHLRLLCTGAIKTVLPPHK